MSETMMADVEQQEDTLHGQFLMFSIEEDEYGLDISNVIDILKMQEITLVPGLPDNVRGIINVRGEIIPVMDVRMRFGYAYKEYTPRTCIIVIEERTDKIGLIVDEVNEVATIIKEELIVPTGVESDGELFISHVMRRGDQNMRIVDSFAMLNQGGVFDDIAVPA